MMRLDLARGFTLVEMVVSLVILGILAALLTPLLKAPIDSYMDSRERTQLSDSTDNALRRIAREIRVAVPNSVRVTNAGNSTFLEFLLTTGGGRYRAAPTGVGTGNPLVFGSAVSQFDVLGPVPNSSGANWVVVGNISASATDQPNAYLPVGNANSSRAACSNCTASPIVITATTFPAAAEFDSRRFFLVSGPVTYECNQATGTLLRYDGYAIAQNQPTPPAVTAVPVLGGGCTINYRALNADVGVVSLSLGFATSNDAGVTTQAGNMTLVQHVQVSNSP